MIFAKLRLRLGTWILGGGTTACLECDRLRSHLVELELQQGTLLDQKASQPLDRVDRFFNLMQGPTTHDDM